MSNSTKFCNYQRSVLQQLILEKIEISYVFADALLFDNEVRQKHIGAILHLTCEAIIKYMDSFADRFDQGTRDLIQMYEECLNSIEQVTDEREKTRKFEILLLYIKRFTVLSEKDEIELLEKEVADGIDIVKTENYINKELENGTYKRTA